MYVWHRVKITPPGVYNTKTLFYSTECFFYSASFRLVPPDEGYIGLDVKVALWKEPSSQACADLLTLDIRLNAPSQGKRGPLTRARAR